MNDKTVLELKDVSIRYKREDFPIQGIGFSIGRRKVFGLAGESGSGKSSVCKAVLGLLDERAASVAGAVCLMGRDLLSLPYGERRRINGKDIAFITQNPMTAFDPCMKIRHHFTETLSAHLLCSKKDAEFYGREMLGRVGLADTARIMNSYPHHLSGGMLQRVMIAIAISLNPVLLVADEPTTALDAESRHTVVRLLQEIVQEYSLAMLFVSHDMNVMSALADDIAVMKGGRIVEMGAAEEIFQNPRHAYTKELLDAGRFIQGGGSC